MSTRSLAVIVGRFQPPHRGHFQLIQQGLEIADRVLVVIGSAFRAASPRNPWSWQERKAMLTQGLSASDTCRVDCLPIRDYFDVQRWAEQLAELVGQFSQNLESDSKQWEIKLLNNFSESAVLDNNRISAWCRVATDRHGTISSREIRDLLFQTYSSNATQLSASTLAVLRSKVPDKVCDHLSAWTQSANYPRLSEEWLALENYKASWQAAPHKPIFVTADSVVRCRNSILLIQRGKAPGKGLSALPGGFVEVDELLERAAVRELFEETCIEIDTSDLRRCLRDRAVSDHPNRSERGRVITHSFYFDLGDRELPNIRAADDAKMANWVPVENLLDMEDQFHDDHFMILDQYLQLLG